ncbi:MAG: ABC-ATPase domain-containing protein, partial [Myxococcota bacterium]
GRSYPAYRDLGGPWTLGALALTVDHVQGDPFASPSRVTVRLDVGLPAAPGVDDPTGVRLATEDWLLRSFVDTLAARGRTSRGSGKSGLIDALRPGPEVVDRSALRLDRTGRATVRLAVGLPARGRRIDGGQARALFDDLREALDALPASPDDPELVAHVASVVRQRALRDQLRARGLVAFVEDGSGLPRASGVSQAPLADAVRFRAPETLAVTLDAPTGPARGLGIREGVTLIVGGGFHGKSTVLDALARGHLDHVPGDGREGVVADPDTVKIRAEDGRRIARVDVSAFLGELPGGRRVAPLSTDDASGSTSQAAAIVEAREAGARVLLIDEDTSATNLLVRDERMRALIEDRHEPITPLVARARQLARAGTSVVMVVGGVGDWLAVADTVLGMTAFEAWDATSRAQALAGPAPAPPGPFTEPSPRRIEGQAPPRRLRCRDVRAIQWGDTDIDLTAIEPVLSAWHARTLGHAVRFVLDGLANGRRTLPQLLDALDAILLDEGTEALSPFAAPSGDLVAVRRHEVAAVLNRLRGLVVVDGLPER